MEVNEGLTVVVKISDNVRERLLRLLVQVRDCDPGSEDGVVLYVFVIGSEKGRGEIEKEESRDLQDAG